MPSDYEVVCSFIEQRERERARACKCDPLIFNKKDLTSAFNKTETPWDAYNWLYRKVMTDKILSDRKVTIVDALISMNGSSLCGAHPRAGTRDFGKLIRRSARAAVDWAIAVETAEFNRRA